MVPDSAEVVPNTERVEKLQVLKFLEINRLLTKKPDLLPIAFELKLTL